MGLMPLISSTLNINVERALASYGPAPAVVDGDREETYAQLCNRTGRLANALAGMTTNDTGVVAILLDNCLEYIEADVAIIRSGNTKVPINTRLSSDEIDYILRDSQAQILLTDKAHAEFARIAVSGDGPLHSAMIVGSDEPDGYEAALANASERFTVPPMNGSEASVILYTSGTTGRPKGAVASLRSRTASVVNMLASEMEISPGDGMVHVGSLAHGSGSKVLPNLLRGVRNIAMPRFDPNSFFAEVNRVGGTSTFVVPTMIAMLVEAVNNGANIPPSLRSIVYGGAPLDADVMTSAIDMFGPIFIQVYGSCEAPHPVTVLSKADHRRALDERTLLASAGRESLLTSVSVVNEAGETVAPRESGELIVSGETVMTGYLNNQEATDEVLDESAYRTGDVGWKDEDGFVYILDRKRDLIISGGLNVYPAEVERVLSQHADVIEAAVIGVRDNRWGERVVAFISTGAVPESTKAELDELSRTMLAGYKKPREYVFVDSIPKGPTGKILKKDLRDLIQTTGSR